MTRLKLNSTPKAGDGRFRNRPPSFVEFNLNLQKKITTF